LHQSLPPIAAAWTRLEIDSNAAYVSLKREFNRFEIGDIYDHAQ